MNEAQYIDFMAWLEMPAHAVKPFDQLTDEDKSSITGSFAFNRFQLNQTSDKVAKSLRDSFRSLFAYVGMK